MAVTLLLATLAASAQRRQGNPLEHLPNNIEVLTHFGERADISPDNQRIAFMNKSFGDAFIIDLKTRIVRCLTCNVPGAAFLRVMHLANGDYILIGPEHFENIRISRTRDNELWYLSKAPGSQPVRFGVKMSEGAAISKKNMRIASRFFRRRIRRSGKAPGLSWQTSSFRAVKRALRIQVVYESKTADCRVEAQDFYNDDRNMTFTCYEPKGLASVMTIDLGTGKAVNMSKAPGSYNEVEGVFPDGEYTLVEMDRQCEQLGGERGSSNIDIWKLKLDGTGKNLTRLTYFNDYEGGKASNPVVATDGRFMAFQSARTTDPAGVGYGILLYWFSK